MSGDWDYALKRRHRLVYRQKWYHPYHDQPFEKQWRILERTPISDLFVVLLCYNKYKQCQGGEYAVFVDLLAPETFPVDKYMGTLKKSGLRAYRDACRYYKKMVGL